MKPSSLSPQAAGHLLALGAVVLWSSLYIAARATAGMFTPVELTFWRWAIAFASFVPFTWRRVYAERALVGIYWIRLMLFSLIGMAGFSLMIFLAGKTTTATNMSLLAATAPIFIAIICHFALRERLSGQQVAGLAVAVCGVVVLVAKGDITHLLDLRLNSGDLWMLFGAMCFGLYTVLVRFRPSGMSPNVFLTVLMGMGVIWMLPFIIWQWLYIAPFVVPSLSTWLVLLHIGISASSVAFLLWNQGIMRIGAVRCGVVYYSLPFFSYILALIFLGEKLSLPQVFGGVLIIGGIALSALKGIRAASRS